MKIKNIDAPKLLAEKLLKLNVPSFVLDVLRPLERKMLQEMNLSIICPCDPQDNSIPLYPIRKFEHFGYEQVANLIHTIPIYLRDDQSKVNDETDIVDPLGVYFQNRQNDNPYIELYVSKIHKAAKGNELFFKWLFTKVLIHELAHAALDIFNCENCQQTVEKVRYCTEFGKWREESMANAVALRIIREYGNQDFYDYAKDFMLSQPAEYALGVLMEDFKHWDFRSVTDGKEDGVDTHLQDEWLKYAKGNPTWEELQRWNEILSNTVYSFNNRYYTQGDLVLDILLDYIKQNGPISFSQLCSVFPNVKFPNSDAYCPLVSVLNHPWYYTEPQQVLHLSDGDYALRKDWDDDYLIDFTSKAIKEKYKIDIILNRGVE